MEDNAAEESGANIHNETATADLVQADSSWDENQSALSRLMSQEGVFQLTQDLRQFSETLTSLKKVFFEEKDSLNRSLRVAAHERLGELLKVLKNIVNKYSELKSSGILSAAENLINHIKNFNYESAEEAVPPEIFSSINNLALAFSSSVSDCLIGDINISPRHNPVLTPQPAYQRHSTAHDGAPDVTPLSSAIIDGTPGIGSESAADVVESSAADNLDICFERAKAWSKYANDLLAYVKKKAHIELEYAKQLTKLSQGTRSALSEQSFLPFQSLYCTALDNDKEYASNVMSMYQTAILAHKFIEPFQARRAEHDRLFKYQRDSWRKDKRWLEEAETNLKKAKQQYQARNHEYQKAKEAATKADQQQYTAGTGDWSHSRQGSGPSSGQLVHGNAVAGNTLGIIPSNVAKAEKKRKQEDDSCTKAIQAEQYYRSCVEEANNRQKEVKKKEVEYLKSLRDMMTQCDQTAKAVTVNFFSLHCDLVSPIRVQYQALLDESKNYEPGSQYMEYLKHITPRCHVDVRHDYKFEPEGPAYMEQNSAAESSPMFGRASHIGQPLAARRTSQRGISDTESSSSRSLDDLSPSASPRVPTGRKDMQKRRPSTEGSLSSEEILDDGKENAEQNRLSGSLSTKDFSIHASESSPALTRPQFQVPKVMKMVNKALKGMKRTSKATVFGVEFYIAALDAADGVPLLVKKCIAEIDNRALTTKGIYRINGVKNRVEKLCSLLDSPHCARADLSEQMPHDVSGVLKYFLRQLPEPLMLYRLYEEFLEVAKKYNEIRKVDKPPDSAAPPVDDAEAEREPRPSPDASEPGDFQTKLAPVLESMRTTVEKLPLPNFNTLQYIISHLSRVAEHHNENKMPASNLAIIFGPTLLKPTPSADGNELQSWIELPSQSQAIEMMISHRNQIFHPRSRNTAAAVDEANSGAVDRTKTPNTIDTEELLQSNDREPDLASSQSSSSLPSEHLPAIYSPTVSVSNGPIPAYGGDALAPMDSYSTSSALSLGDSFASVTDAGSPRPEPKEGTSGDSSLTSQSNGGMSLIDNDGRKVVSHSPRLKKSSSCEFQGGFPPAFLDGQHVAHCDITTGKVSSGALPRPCRPQHGTGSSATAGPFAFESGRLRTTATNEGHAVAKGHPSPTQAQRDGKPPDERGLAGVPAVPLRTKSRRSSKPPVELQSDSQKLASPPHRPRSRLMGGNLFRTSRDKHDLAGTEDPGLRRASVAGSPTVPARSSPSKEPKRRSVAAGIGLSMPHKSDPSSAGGRKLPQVPPSITSDLSTPVRSVSRPMSMPGRTPPFNATHNWTFGKAGVMDIDNLSPERLNLQKNILHEAGDGGDSGEDVSFC